MLPCKKLAGLQNVWKKAFSILNIFTVTLLNISTETLLNIFFEIFLC